MQPEELRGAIVRRVAAEVKSSALDGLGPTLRIEIELKEPLSDADLDRIRLEAQRTQEAPAEGTLTVLRAGRADLDDLHQPPPEHTAERSEPRVRIRLDVAPIARDAIRLDTLLSQLARVGSPLGRVASAHVVERLATALGDARRSREGASAQTSGLHAGSVVVCPKGSVTWMGSMLPLLDALLAPDPGRAIDRVRGSAPEVVRKEPFDVRADVYSLGVLYYALLSGCPYRAHLSEEEVRRAAIEGHEPDLPARLPDPRPALIELLGTALAADPARRFPSMEALAGAVREECARAESTSRESVGLDDVCDESPSGRAMLARLIAELLPPDTTSGVHGLFAANTENPAAPAIIGRPIIGRAIGVAESDGAAFVPVPPIAAARGETEEVPASPPLEPRHEDVWTAAPEDVSTVEETAAPPSPAPPSPAPPSPAPPSSPQRDPIGARAFPLATTLDRRERSRSALNLLRGAVIAMVVLIAVGLYVGVVGRFREARDRSVFAPAPKTPAPSPAPTPASARAPAPAPSPPPGSDTIPLPATPPGAAATPKTPSEAEAKPVGLISVLSRPSGATVELDGGYIGTTPLILHHTFEKSVYQLKVLANGYKPWTRDVTIDSEHRTLSVMATLEQSP